MTVDELKRLDELQKEIKRLDDKAKEGQEKYSRPVSSYSGPPLSTDQIISIQLDGGWYGPSDYD